MTKHSHSSLAALRVLAFVILHSSFVILTSCSSVSSTSGENDASVIYALPPLTGFPSPLDSTLTPVCPALEFSGSSLNLSDEHQRVLGEFFAEAEKTPATRYLIVGYAPPDLSEDHARSLTERRALGLRHHLIELGMDAGRIQCSGLGNDFAQSKPARHVVLIYKQR